MREPIPDADYKASGTVKVAVSSYRPCDYEAMLDAFSAVYPNIDLVLDYRPKHGADADETNHYLASRAMAGNMPDVEAGKRRKKSVSNSIEPAGRRPGKRCGRANGQMDRPVESKEW